MCIDPMLGAHDNVTMLTGAYVSRLGTDATGRRVDAVHVERDGKSEVYTADTVVVACGALGVVHTVTLSTVDSFAVRQFVYEHLPLDRALESLEWLLASAYSVSLFIDWSKPEVSQVWKKALADHDDNDGSLTQLLGARLADGPRHPIAGMSADQCTTQMGIAGPWNERLPHFRADQPPSAAGDELQSEFFVDRRDAHAAIAELLEHREKFAHLVQVGEIRSIAADELWLSPCQGRDSVAIHFTWRHDQQGVLAALATVEQVLRPYGARPHWGKLFVAEPHEIAARYARLKDFAALRALRDPNAKFANAFVHRYFTLSE